jgi:hypothetical protein
VKRKLVWLGTHSFMLRTMFARYMKRHPFKRGQLVFGSLVPWRGEWYWSGEQKFWDDASKVDVDDLKQDMKRRSSRIVCRYSTEYETQVRQRASAMHEQMLAFHPDEGKEIMTHFTTLIVGLKKKGQELSEEEELAARGFIESEAVSPSFVRRVLGEYGEESVKTAFLLRGDLPGYWLEYLLRSRKGHFYRNRYPTLAVV